MTIITTEIMENMGTNELDFYYNLNYTCCELLLGTCLYDLELFHRRRFAYHRVGWQSWLHKANTLWIVEMILAMLRLLRQEEY